MSALSLQDPSFEDLQKIYRKLQRFEVLQLQCETSTLNQTLKNLEKIGFIGIKVHWPLSNNKAAEIHCTKGKHGPCYDTGQTATYCGNALAVLDDDAHILFQSREQPICLKTANIYQSETYSAFAKVSTADQEKLEKIKSDPILFDCDDYSDSVDHLLALCPDTIESNLDQSIFYSGPFKAMITPSGHLIRRGQWCCIPKDQVNLLKKEGLQLRQESSEKAQPLKALLQNQGKKALLDIDFTDIEKSSTSPFTSAAFRGISEYLKEKLIYCIEEHQDYIMLVGSDPQDQLGCCPSEDVGMANQLMRAGVLSKAKQDVDENQCPINLYAFQNELSQSENGIEFQKNEILRQQVLKSLEPSKNTRVVRWVLFIFILISLLLAFKKIGERYRFADQKTVQGLIQEHQLTKTSFVLFHHEVRCEMCLEMEKYTRSFAQKHNLSLITINMDLAEWKQMIEKHQLFSAALFCLQPNLEDSKKVTLIKNAWDTWNDPHAFHELLQQSLP